MSQGSDKEPPSLRGAPASMATAKHPELNQEGDAQLLTTCIIPSAYSSKLRLTVVVIFVVIITIVIILNLKCGGLSSSQSSTSL